MTQTKFQKSLGDSLDDLGTGAVVKSVDDGRIGVVIAHCDISNSLFVALPTKSAIERHSVVNHFEPVDPSCFEIIVVGHAEFERWLMLSDGCHEYLLFDDGFNPEN